MFMIHVIHLIYYDGDRHFLHIFLMTFIHVQYVSKTRQPPLFYTSLTNSTCFLDFFFLNIRWSDASRCIYKLLNTTRVSKEFRVESSEIGSKQNVIFTNSSLFFNRNQTGKFKKKKKKWFRKFVNAIIIYRKKFMII